MSGETIKKRLEWDKVGERFYETGVDRGVLYPRAANGSYPLGVAWNGLTKVNENPSGGESTKLYANNGTYLDLRSAEENAGSISAYTYPDEFAECDGSVTVGPGFKIRQQIRKAFGFCYRTLIGNDVDDTSKGYKLHLIYGATAKPSSRENNTVNDSPEAVELSWDYETVPVPISTQVGGKTLKPTASLEFDSTDPNLPDGFLEALEDILYGKDGIDDAATDPYLPLPDDIITLYNQYANPTQQGEH